MKKVYFIFSLFLLISCSKSDNLQPEITLFNQDGEATAYYIQPQDEQVIYLWNGRPTAYIVATDEFIYGFNGQFLGWIEQGVIFDLEGKRVGFEKDALNQSTLAEPAKFAKMAIPAKFAKDAAPAKPSFSQEWSAAPLDSFLIEGM